MTRDYAKKSAPKRRKTRPAGPPGWVWLLTGVLLGVLITVLVELAKLPDESIEHIQSSENDKEDTQHPKPRFEFYTLLSESEVIVPDGPKGEDGLRGEPDKQYVFLLQAGSFKNPRDADSLRARLLLINLSARIETFSPRKGEKWYRVLVGPFDRHTDVASARAKLASNQIDSLLLKRKK